MHAERFRRLVRATGPFVSIYFDDSHDTQDAAAQLDARLRDIRKHLEEQSVDATVIEAIGAAVHAKRPPVGRSGREVKTSTAAGIQCTKPTSPKLPATADRKGASRKPFARTSGKSPNA